MPQAEDDNKTPAQGHDPAAAGVPAAELPPPERYVSRGALKLHAALAAFAIDPSGLVCADFGCSTGGFTHVLIEHGAARVYAIDTAYGQLAWTLRQHDRVRVMERTNALHAEPPPEVTAAGGITLAVIDLGWTPQRLALPAALRWLAGPGREPPARIVTLVKPHYEADKGRLAPGGTLLDDEARRVSRDAIESAAAACGLRVQGLMQSPLRGGAPGKKKKKRGTGNLEWLAVCEHAG